MQENLVSDETVRGVVSFYDVRRGFGFIRGDDGVRVFVHRSEVPFWSIYLQKGERVLYRVVESKRGPVAVGVVMVES